MRLHSAKTKGTPTNLLPHPAVVISSMSSGGESGRAHQGIMPHCGQEPSASVPSRVHGWYRHQAYTEIAKLIGAILDAYAERSGGKAATQPDPSILRLMR